MNSKIFSVFSAAAIALMATAPLSHAVVYSSSQFTTALKTAVGTKKGAAAYNAAAKLYKKALQDKANSKNVIKYTKSVLKVLNKKVIPDPLAGKSRSVLVKALCDGYFKPVKYNALDSKFQAALKLLSSKLPIGQQTTEIAKLIAQPALDFNTKKGGTQAYINAINATVYDASHLPVPPS